MPPKTTRAGKGSALTHNELDDNFRYGQNRISGRVSSGDGVVEELTATQTRGIINVALNNYTATVAPVAANDNTEGYGVGSLWVDVTAQRIYQAVNVTTGAAVWAELTASVLSNPGNDRLTFFDNSDNTFDWLLPGDGLSITDKTMNVGNLAASAIASGTLNTARMGSGTADNTRFLRGDNTWQVPPTSPGSGNAWSDPVDSNIIPDGQGTRNLGGANRFGSTNTNTIELGHASDTTIARTAAGRATIEGAEIVRSSTSQGGAGVDVVQNIVSCTQAEYDALTKNATTFYMITDAT